MAHDWIVHLVTRLSLLLVARVGIHTAYVQAGIPKVCNESEHRRRWIKKNVGMNVEVFARA